MRRVLFSFLGVFLLFPLCSRTTSAQPTSNRYWVFLKERSSLSSFLPSDLGITERALRRRAKVLPKDRLIDESDIPPSPEILRRIQLSGVRIHSISRWLNAVSIEINSLQHLQEIHSLNFVHRVAPVGRMKKTPMRFSSLPSLDQTLRKREALPIDYGSSFTQLNNIKVVDAHGIGIYGTGILIGLLDDGFNNHRVHPALRNIRVVAEFDFVHRDSNTSRAPWEYFPQGNHGAGVLSSVGGFDNGSLIGAAFGASFILAKTEIDSVEVHIEEDNYVEALEWMERLGVDIASSSLGYRDFDTTTYSYTYQELNGKTTIVSRAAGIAARKGVLLCTAMGNGGFQTAGRPPVSVLGTLVAPADADSIVSVGAAYSDGILADFSGTGPTSDGRIKPEVVAQGTGVRWASGSGSGYVSANGTSASTPLVAGVAALVLSAHPQLTPMQIRESLLNTAVHIQDGTTMTTSYPNNYYGWGFANALGALLYHGIVFSNLPTVSINNSTMTVSTFIRSSSPLLNDSLFLYYQSASGLPFERVSLTPTSTPFLFQATIPTSVDTNYPRGYFVARDETGRSRLYPPLAPDSLLAFRALINTGIPGLPGIVPDSFVLHANFPNPFNAGTTILFDAPSPEPVELHLYNLLGQRIRTLFRGIASVGSNSVYWDGLDDRGVAAPSGTYFSRLHASSTTLTQKMLLIR